MGTTHSHTYTRPFVERGVGGSSVAQHKSAYYLFDDFCIFFIFAFRAHHRWISVSADSFIHKGTMDSCNYLVGFTMVSVFRNCLCHTSNDGGRQKIVQMFVVSYITWSMTEKNGCTQFRERVKMGTFGDTRIRCVEKNPVSIFFFGNNV